MTKIFNIFFGAWLSGAHPTPLGCTVQRVRFPLLVEIESDHIIAVVADDPLGEVGCRFVADRNWYIYHKNHSLNRNRPRVQGSGAVGQVRVWDRSAGKKLPANRQAFVHYRHGVLTSGKQSKQRIKQQTQARKNRRAACRQMWQRRPKRKRDPSCPVCSLAW